MDIKDQYEACKDVRRRKPDIAVTEDRRKSLIKQNLFTAKILPIDIARQIGRNYRTLPSFEKGLFEYVYKQHYSLQRNELLKCRWGEYKKHIEERVFAPFQFPCTRDLHFYNGCIRFLPSESVYLMPSHRMKLRPGPGVDFRGQMPIPQELMMKRGRIKKENVKSKQKM